MRAERESGDEDCGLERVAARRDSEGREVWLETFVQKKMRIARIPSEDERKI